MEDKLIPVEAEVLEYGAEPGKGSSLPADSYGTATPPRPKKSYVGLWIFLGLIIIGICTLGIVASVSSMHFQHNPDGGWTLTMDPVHKPGQEEQVKNLPPSARGDTADAAEAPVGSMVRINFDQGRLETRSADAVYAAAAPSVVCLKMTASYGTLTYTGVVLSSDGYILSAADDLSSALAISVRFSDGSELPAAQVWEETRSGLCLVKVEAEDLTPASFASAEDLQVGNRIYCIANPYGAVIPNILSDGLLSARQTVEVEGTEYHILQTSAELQQSGYGCPILDSAGRVVGMTTAIGRYLVSGSDPCFALSSGDLQSIVAAFSGESQKKDLWLGLVVEEIPERYSFLYRYPGKLWITSVSELSGYKDVLYPYDVITAVNGSSVNSLAEFNAAVSACRAGEKVRLTIYRTGHFYYADLKILTK